MTATWYAAVPKWLADAARDALEAIGAWAGALSAVDLVLLAAGLFALYWLWSTLHAINKLGPVEVAVLEQDGPETDPPAVNALTAKLRERLSKSGLLPPPAVPGGSPQTNLIAAVEASGAPQSAFVAKLLSLLPQAASPPEFKVQGTLIGPQRNTSGLPTADTYGLAYWLQPKTAGPTQIGSIETKAGFEEAIEEVAGNVYLAIAREAVHVFPAWSQWGRTEDYLVYMEGIFARLCGNDAEAEGHFDRAATAEPSNPLPRLQLVNLLEQRSAARRHLTAEVKALISRRAPLTETSVVEVANDAFDLAAVLGQYLDIAAERPDLASARYRASVVAGVLATLHRQMNPPPEQDQPPPHHLLTDSDEARIRALIGEHRVAGDLDTALETLANKQSKEVKRLLRLHHVLVRHGRLRRQFVPAGSERRQLIRTVALGRHALRVRAFRERSDRGARWGVTWRSVVVRVWHLPLLGIQRDWNARYNAGCFYTTRCSMTARSTSV